MMACILFIKYLFWPRGTLAAQLVERVPHVQRLCPRCSVHGFNSTLWPFAACHSLSFLFPVQFFSCPIK